MNEEQSFKLVYESHKRLVYNLALNYTQNTADAQDITQEVFVKIYQNLKKHQDEKASLKTWIYRITINHSLDFLKARRTRKRFGFLTSLFGNDSSEPIADAESYDHPGIALEDKEELTILFKIINTLPDNQKTVLILLKIDDRTQKEVAEIMGLSTKAVESLFQRAKQSLAKKIAGTRRNRQ
jgi:RNA polymerase sigma-70 factor (ECF subfamily)